MPEQKSSLLTRALISAAFTAVAATASADEPQSIGNQQPVAGVTTSKYVSEQDKERHRKILERNAEMVHALVDITSLNGHTPDHDAVIAAEKAKIAKEATGRPADIRKAEKTAKQLEKNILDYAKALKVSRA